MRFYIHRRLSGDESWYNLPTFVLVYDGKVLFEKLGKASFIQEIRDWILNDLISATEMIGFSDDFGGKRPVNAALFLGDVKETRNILDIWGW